MTTTIRLVLKTSKGFIVVRNEDRGQWGFVEFPYEEYVEDARRFIQNWIRMKTGLILNTSAIGTVQDSKDGSGEYVLVRVDDVPLMSQIRPRGEDGTQVKEASYWEAEMGMTILKPVRNFLKRNKLLTPP